MKAIFLDRDGVINHNVIKLVRPEQFKMIDGVAEVIKKINDNGYLTIIITNQSVIAKGFCTFKGMEKIHEKMKKILSEKGAHIDAIYICPHHPESGFKGEVKELKIECDCRKPKPGLLLKAIKEHNINITKSWMIGDSNSDILAGQKVEVKTILVGDKSVNKNLKEAVDFIFKFDGVKK